MEIQGVVTLTPGTALTDDDAVMLVSGRGAESVDDQAASADNPQASLEDPALGPLLFSKTAVANLCSYIKR